MPSLGYEKFTSERAVIVEDLLGALNDLAAAADVTKLVTVNGTAELDELTVQGQD